MSPVSGGDTLPEEAADLLCREGVRAAAAGPQKVTVKVAPATPVPMFSSRKAQTALKGKYSVLNVWTPLEP